MKFKSLTLFSALLVLSCNTNYTETIVPLDSYHLEEGFQMESIASEPLLIAPVTMDFDNDGRIWVAEMNGYMNNMDGKGEESPLGAIKILEDRDGDGVHDHAKIFLDSLVLPRALAHVYGGLLYAEPPNLWFVEIEDDLPVNKVLVDSMYAPDGNPEHQPNGLEVNIDNWIYNAKSHFRYRLKNGKWLKEATTFRGQWGITHDNFGRLYFNDNSRQLLGDYILPNRLISNKFLKPKHGVNRLLTSDQRVYPLHASLVNRGYADGILNKDSLLVDVTAACGPLVYRGGQFLKDYEENVFVCVPEANLIKRNILRFYGDSTVAKQAWEDKEFLASTDEGFRPVSLKNGPDGALYVVDMHRGVIGHHAYLSPYFKEKAKEKLLDTIIGRGRILKIKHSNSTYPNRVDLEGASDKQLLNNLRHTNGWIRDRSQQLLIEHRNTETIEPLEVLLTDYSNETSQIHALYTLEGMDALNPSLLFDVAKNGGEGISSHAMALLEQFANQPFSEAYLDVVHKVFRENNISKDLYLTGTLGKWATHDEQSFMPLILEYSIRYKNNPILSEALISGSESIMEKYKSILDQNSFDTESNLYRMLETTLNNKSKSVLNPIYVSEGLKEDSRTKGAKIFRQICAACHGINGEGSEGLAPPLINSDYISKPIERLALIILNGLKGPVHVNGELYEMNQAMPGLGANESLSDKDIADIITYVSNAFANRPQGISEEKIKNLRAFKSQNGNEYTEEELLQLTFE